MGTASEAGLSTRVLSFIVKVIAEAFKSAFIGSTFSSKGCLHCYFQSIEPPYFHW